MNWKSTPVTSGLGVQSTVSVRLMHAQTSGHCPSARLRTAISNTRPIRSFMVACLSSTDGIVCLVCCCWLLRGGAHYHITDLRPSHAQFQIGTLMYQEYIEK